ncbi:MAG: OmpH family outer membrane protein [Acidobacteriota bacterium]
MSSTRTQVRRLLLAALIVALVVPVAASAQEMKYAVIDTEEVLRSSAVGKAALAELQTLQEAKQTEGEALAKEIQDLQKRITEGQLSLADDKLAELETEFEQKGIALRRFQDDANRELNKKREEVLGKIDQQVMPLIASYGQEQGYAMIFRKYESGLVFASDEVDITQDIIQRLDSAN